MSEATLVPQAMCSICGSPRNDPDATGVTCGRAECLAVVGERFNDIFNLREFVTPREQRRRQEQLFDLMEAW